MSNVMINLFISASSSGRWSTCWY